MKSINQNFSVSVTNREVVEGVLNHVDSVN